MEAKQNQKSGDASLNIQAKDITINQGMSLEEVRQIALDVYQANFYKLSGIAAETADKRVEELTNNFLKELMERNPSGVNNAIDPDFQYSLFTAQKEYARSGDKELGDILVDILVDRTKEDKRTILQIVLNESLLIAPKLTKNQLDALSIIFSLKYTKYLRMVNLEAIKHYLNYRIYPFIASLTKNAASYQHLEYAGCGTAGFMITKIESIFLKQYPGIFSKGFSEDEMNKITEKDISAKKMFTRCLQNESFLEVNGIDDDTIRKSSLKHNLQQPIIDELIALQKKYLMSEQEVREYILSLDDIAKELFDKWENSAMNRMTLTSVGIAIGHANTRRITKEGDNLSIWIN